MKLFKKMGKGAALAATALMFSNIFAFAGGDKAMADTTDNVTIYLAGDSTVCDWDAIRGEGYYEPQAGWGQMLYRYFDDTVTVKNGAISGYSSKTFYQGCVAKNDPVHHLEELIKDAKEGDYLLVQFGHNDSSKPTEEQLVTRPDIAERHVEPDEFKEWLLKYVNDARAKGVVPVLVTPCGRYSISNGKFVSNFTGYVDAMKALAEEENVLLVDLDAKSRAYYNELGQEGAKDVFLFCEAGMYDSYYSKGTEDKTHFQKFGAIQLARMVAEGLKEANAKGLVERMNENVARPENVPAAPTNVTVIKDKGTMFSFTWDEVEGADLYTVYKVIMNSGKEKVVVAKQTEENKCVFTDIKNDGKQYAFYVVSKNMTGESEASERVLRGDENNTTKNKGNNITLPAEENNGIGDLLPIIGIVAGVVVVAVAVVAAVIIIKKKKK